MKQCRYRMRGRHLFLILVMFVMFLILLCQYTLSRGFSRSKYSRQPSLNAVYKRKGGDKWIVTSSMKTLDVNKLPGWKVLVYDVPDRLHCSPPTCFCLEDELQEYPQFQNIGYSRKLTAYLLAIAKGATCIYSVKHWHNEMSDILKTFVYDETTSGIVAMTNKSVITPGSIFSSGTRADNVTSLSYPPYYSHYEYVLLENIHPLLQSVFQPNIDHKSSQTPKSSYDPQPVFLPANTFTSLDFESTLFHHDVFWSFVLTQLPFGDLITQKLLWELGGLVMVYAHSSSGDTQQTTDSALRNPLLMELIQRFECKPNLSIIACLEYITQLLREKALVSIQAEKSVQTWILYLKLAGYQSPRRSEMKKPILNRKEQTFGIFSTLFQKLKPQNIALTRLRKICPKENLPKPIHIIRDIALIITFNTPSLYDKIPILEAMYKPYFQHLIYCGPNIEKFRLYAQNSTGYYNFIEAFKKGWYYMFECTAEALKMNINVRGFLQIGDDTLLNSWNLKGLPRDKIWLHTGIRSANSSLEELKPNWIWWKNGKKGINNLLQEMSAAKKYHLHDDLEYRFLERFKNSSKNFTQLYIQGCDFMYMPVKLKADFLKLSSLLIKHEIMLEIGFANIALGLQRREDIYFVKDGSLWDNRSQNKEVYNSDMVFLHPFKLRDELGHPKGRAFFCNVYMKYVKNNATHVAF